MASCLLCSGAATSGIARRPETEVCRAPACAGRIHLPAHTRMNSSSSFAAVSDNQLGPVRPNELRTRRRAAAGDNHLERHGFGLPPRRGRSGNWHKAISGRGHRVRPRRTGHRSHFPMPSPPCLVRYLRSSGARVQRISDPLAGYCRDGPAPAWGTRPRQSASWSVPIEHPSAGEVSAPRRWRMVPGAAQRGLHPSA